MFMAAGNMLAWGYAKKLDQPVALRSGWGSVLAMMAWRIVQ